MTDDLKQIIKQHAPCMAGDDKLVNKTAERIKALFPKPAPCAVDRELLGDTLMHLCSTNQICGGKYSEDALDMIIDMFSTMTPCSVPPDARERLWNILMQTCKNALGGEIADVIPKIMSIFTAPRTDGKIVVSLIKDDAILTARPEGVKTENIGLRIRLRDACRKALDATRLREKREPAKDELESTDVEHWKMRAEAAEAHIDKHQARAEAAEARLAKIMALAKGEL